MIETPTILPMDNLQVELVLESLELPPDDDLAPHGTEVVVIQARADEPLEELGEPEWVAGDLKAWILNPSVVLYGIPGI